MLDTHTTAGTPIEDYVSLHLLNEDICVTHTRNCRHPQSRTIIFDSISDDARVRHTHL